MMAHGMIFFCGAFESPVVIVSLFTLSREFVSNSGGGSESGRSMCRTKLGLYRERFLYARHADHASKLAQLVGAARARPACPYLGWPVFFWHESSLYLTVLSSHFLLRFNA